MLQVEGSHFEKQGPRLYNLVAKHNLSSLHGVNMAAPDRATLNIIFLVALCGVIEGESYG